MANFDVHNLLKWATFKNKNSLGDFLNLFVFFIFPKNMPSHGDLILFIYVFPCIINVVPPHLETLSSRYTLTSFFLFFS